VTSDPEAFELVTTGFYRSRDVDLARGALRHWLRMVASADEAGLARMAALFYVFARIGQTSEAAREAFEPLLRGFAGPHAELAQRLLQLPGDSSFPNALDLPIERPENLDLLWAEFFVTGSAPPVLRIVSTLDWDDRVRQRFEAWLHERSFFGRSKRASIAAALASVGIVTDVERKLVVSAGDLDLACFAIAEKRIPIFTMLPFQLTPAELARFAIKGSALWSLRLNAKAHETVAEICRAEAKRPGGPARAGLDAALEASASPFAL
jgi:hypothetical protein